MEQRRRRQQQRSRATEQRAKVPAKIDSSAVYAIKCIVHPRVSGITNENDIEVNGRGDFLLSNGSARLDEGLLKPSQLHRVRCLESGCSYQMLAISDLRNHLANQHMKPEYKTTEEKKFNSFTGQCRTFIRPQTIDPLSSSSQNLPNGKRPSNKVADRNT